MSCKLDYKKQAVIVDNNEGKDVAQHRITIEGDDQGFYTKSVIYAHGPQWMPDYRGEPLVTIYDQDWEYSIEFHRVDQDSVKVNLNISDLSYLRTLIETISRLSKFRHFQKYKITRAKETRRIKPKK